MMNSFLGARGSPFGQGAESRLQAAGFGPGQNALINRVGPLRWSDCFDGGSTQAAQSLKPEARSLASEPAARSVRAPLATLVLLIRNHPLDLGVVTVGDDERAAQMTLPLGRLAAEQMALECA